MVTEILSEHDVDLVERYTDIFQVGARNMQNFALLKALGETRRPVLLKRSMMGTIEELLLSAEYIMKGGNSHVILCERGIRTFETQTRNTLDIAAVPVIKRLSHLPILVDPSHAMGDWHYVAPASLAALAAGADGIIVEIHPDPAMAKSDGKQSLNHRALRGRCMEQASAPWRRTSGSRCVSAPSRAVKFSYNKPRCRRYCSQEQLWQNGLPWSGYCSSSQRLPLPRATWRSSSTSVSPTDARYFMFGQYGIAEKSSAPWADTFIVDVPANAFAPQGDAASSSARSRSSRVPTASGRC